MGDEEVKDIKTDIASKDVEMIDTSAASPDKASSPKPGSPTV